MKLNTPFGVVDTDYLLQRLDASSSAIEIPTGTLCAIAAALIRKLLPKAGTGACVCRQSPERVAEQANAWGVTFEDVGINILLDHRCTKHGEKVQPTLWGRHEELELRVSPAEWLALGNYHENREVKREAFLRKLLTDAEYSLSPQPQDRNMPIGMDTHSMIAAIRELL